MRRIIPLILLVLLIANIPFAVADSRPELDITVDQEIIVSWEMTVRFSGVTDFAQKAEEFHRARNKNYNRLFEKRLSKYMSEMFTEHTGRQITVNVTYLKVDGDGSVWDQWMKTTITFTIQNATYLEGNNSYVDMSWLTITMTRNSTYGKVSFEDKEDTETVYSFYPKYLLAMNWKDYFNWDLTARPSETVDEGIVLTLPMRRKYRPYEEFPDVSAQPNDPDLKILVKNKDAVFESNRIRIPLPPRQLSDLEKTILFLKGKQTVIFGGLGVLSIVTFVWIYASHRYADKRRHQDSKIEGQKKAEDFSNKLASWREQQGLPKRQVYGGKGDFKIEKKPVSESFLKAHGFDVRYSLWEKIKKIILRK